MCITAMPWSADLRVRAPRPGITSGELECSPMHAGDLYFANGMLPHSKSGVDLSGLLACNGSVKSWGSACSTAIASPLLSRSSSSALFEEGVVSHTRCQVTDTSASLPAQPAAQRTATQAALSREQSVGQSWTPTAVGASRTPSQADPVGVLCKHAHHHDYSSFLLDSELFSSANHIMGADEMLSIPGLVSSTLLHSEGDLLSSVVGQLELSMPPRTAEEPVAGTRQHWPAGEAPAAPRESGLHTSVQCCVSSSAMTLEWPSAAMASLKRGLEDVEAFQAGPIMLQPTTASTLMSQADSTFARDSKAPRWALPPCHPAGLVAPGIKHKNSTRVQEDDVVARTAQQLPYARQLSEGVAQGADAPAESNTPLLRGLSGVR